MNNEERFNEIKNNFKYSNKYILTIDYDDASFLINYIESLQKENSFLKELYSGTDEFKSIERGIN